jgi:glycosyltransferase involved in cell wall biosynthesis
MSKGVAIDVLIPTRNRCCALAVTLAALSAQTMRRFRIVISDQSEGPGPFATAEHAALARYLTAGGIELEALRHTPRLGMAEQRAFLLSRVQAPYCLFIDDDVIAEPDLLERLYDAIVEQQCGFVGSALHGLSHLGDQRPWQQHIEFWDGPVQPEQLSHDDEGWERHHLHSAANLFHLQQKLQLAATRCYRVAWIGGCVLFDTGKLRASGGFDFWRLLPAEHCGEDVYAQLRVMERFGGCGIIPSGAYHMELPTTVANREVDVPVVMRR